MTTTATDPAAVILDRAAAGKPLTADEVALLRGRLDRNPLISDQEGELRRQLVYVRAERDELAASLRQAAGVLADTQARAEKAEQAVATRRLMQREYTSHGQEQAEQIRTLTEELARSERRRRDVQAHLDIAHDNIRTMRAES